MPVSYPHGVVQKAVDYISLESKGEVYHILATLESGMMPFRSRLSSEKL